MAKPKPNKPKLGVPSGSGRIMIIIPWKDKSKKPDKTGPLKKL